MSRSPSTKILVLLAACVVALAGCSKDKEEASGSGLAATDSLLQYVPADTPYVLANMEPIPAALYDKIEPKLDEMLAAYREVLTEVMAVARDTAGKDIDEDATVAMAVIDELAALMSLEGLRSAGFDRESKMVLYGNGLLPVLRAEVSDVSAFNATLARIQEKAGSTMPVAEVGGQAYRYIEQDEIRMIIATFDDHVVFTIAPREFDDAQIGELIGVTGPATSIAKAGTLQAVSRQYGYTSHYVGLVDIKGLAGRFLGDATGLDAALMTLSEKQRPELTAVCQAEFAELAGIAPRMVFGYTRLSESEIGSQAVVELRDDIAKGLMALPSTVPGLGSDPGGLMALGMSLDVKAARAFYEARLDALDKDPYECAALADLQAGVASGRQALSQPVPPMVYDFKGFLAVVNAIEGLDLVNNTPPTSVDGRFLLAMDNAPALLAMGQMFSPELAALSIEPDAKPVRFESAQLQGIVDTVYMAMTDSGLALSFGEGMQDGLDDMLAADGAADGTLLSFSMDAGRYYAFVGQAMLLAEEDPDEAMPAEMRDGLNRMMLSLSELYDRMAADVRLTARGIEINSSITIKD